MPRSITLNATFPPELLQQLRDAAVAEDISAGALIRRAVRGELLRLQLTREDREPRRPHQVDREAGRG